MFKYLALSPGPCPADCCLSCLLLEELQPTGRGLGTNYFMSHEVCIISVLLSLFYFSSAVVVVICRCWPEGGDWWVEGWRSSALQMIEKPSP